MPCRGFRKGVERAVCQSGLHPEQGAPDVGRPGLGEAFQDVVIGLSAIQYGPINGGFLQCEQVQNGLLSEAGVRGETHADAFGCGACAVVAAMWAVGQREAPGQGVQCTRRGGRVFGNGLENTLIIGRGQSPQKARWRGGVARDATSDPVPVAADPHEPGERGGLGIAGDIGVSEHGLDDGDMAESDEAFHGFRGEPRIAGQLKREIHPAHVGTPSAPAKP